MSFFRREEATILCFNEQESTNSAFSRCSVSMGKGQAQRFVSEICPSTRRSPVQSTLKASPHPADPEKYHECSCRELHLTVSGCLLLLRIYNEDFQEALGPVLGSFRPVLGCLGFDWVCLELSWFRLGLCLSWGDLQVPGGSRSQEASKLAQEDPVLRSSRLPVGHLKAVLDPPWKRHWRL